jgi:two-component system, sensor histidine kinase and response regulator
MLLNTVFGSARFLIVDDQIANVLMLKDFLNSCGYEEVYYITDSRKFESSFNEYKPDIVLLDLNMPRVSGYEILSLLQDLNQSEYLPVIVLTADITVEAKRKALLLGASDFLSKPFDLIELQARVNTHLQIRLKNAQIINYSNELSDLIAVREKFFSIISHDLKNPFAAIVNFSKILLHQFDKLSKDDIKVHINTIYDSTREGQKLLENLLIWSKSNTGKMDVAPVLILVKPMINKVLSLYDLNIQEKNIHVITDFVEGPVVMSDQYMIETILRNIISNAIKYTHSGGRILIKCFKANDMLHIIVSDNGIGMSSDDLSKLFRHDYKMQSRRGTGNEGGTGLGLIISKEFMDMLQGSIEAKSKVGSGTEFEIRIPDFE